jgi:hypothetical protein
LRRIVRLAKQADAMMEVQGPHVLKFVHEGAMLYPLPRNGRSRLAY